MLCFWTPFVFLLLTELFTCCFGIGVITTLSIFLLFYLILVKKDFAKTIKGLNFKIRISLFVFVGVFIIAIPPLSGVVHTSVVIASLMAFINATMLFGFIGKKFKTFWVTLGLYLFICMLGGLLIQFL